MRIRRRTALRLLACLLLVAALAGGLWWNATRLNESERKLVGVWEADEAYNWILLPNRRGFSPNRVNGKWQCSPQPTVSWQGTPGWFRLRALPPRTTTLTAWRDYVVGWWSGETHAEAKLDFLSPDEIQVEIEGEAVPFRRSTDPELLRIFGRLSAGESP